MINKKLIHIIKRKRKNTLLRDKSNNEVKYTYNREAAKEYAQIYAELPNTREYPIYKENDCTNFVCQVLIAGGMNMRGADYTKFSEWFCYTKDSSALKKCSLTWRSARYFRLYWGTDNNVGNNMAKEYREFTVEEAIEKFDELYEYIMIGDIIQYADSNKIPYHSQVVTSKEFNIVTDKHDIFIAQHSANRKHVSLHEYWRLLRNGKGRYIFIYHF